MLVVTVMVVSIDQVTKAVQPDQGFVVNTAGAAFVPSTLGNALWRSHTYGALTDAADAALLIGALLMTRTLSSCRQQAAATAALAGLLSNLLDRVGAASLFHSDLPRGAIDWIPLGTFGTANVADAFVALGAGALCVRAGRRVGTVARTKPARRDLARTTAAAALVITVSGWTTWWQDNRAALQRPDTALLCFAQTHPSNGMDWLSFGSSGPPAWSSPPAGRRC